MTAKKEPKSDQLNVRIGGALRERLEKASSDLKIDKTAITTILLTAFLDKLDEDGEITLPLKITIGTKKASY